MKINLMFFARARELVGRGQLEMHVSDDATVGELKHQLVTQFPELSAILNHCAIAVDQEYAGDSRRLREGCEVGCIPPVSGG